MPTPVRRRIKFALTTMWLPYPAGYDLADKLYALQMGLNLLRDATAYCLFGGDLEDVAALFNILYTSHRELNLPLECFEAYRIRIEGQGIIISLFC
jgi:hypothetical protein